MQNFGREKLGNLANSNKFVKVLLLQITLYKVFTRSVTISVKILCKHVLAWPSFLAQCWSWSTFVLLRSYPIPMDLWVKVYHPQLYCQQMLRWRICLKTNIPLHHTFDWKHECHWSTSHMDVVMIKMINCGFITVVFAKSN